MSSRFYPSPALSNASQSNEVALSDLGKLKSALVSFQSAAQSLTGSGLNLFTATSSDPAVVTANSSSGSSAVSFAVVGNTLAQ